MLKDSVQDHSLLHWSPQGPGEMLHCPRVMITAQCCKEGQGDDI